METTVKNMTSSYRLPCVYCKDGVSFPSSSKLKEHLMGSHKNLVCGTQSYGDINKDERSAAVLKTQNPIAAEPTKIFKPDQYHRGGVHSLDKNSPSSSFTSPSHLIQTRLTEYEGMFKMQEKKLKLVSELLFNKEKENEKLQIENKNLKCDSQIKDEEFSRVRQRWRNEAEDALRSMTTSYEDVLTQKRLVEKQILISEQEKEKLRASNDRLEKDLAELNAKTASEKRILQLKEDTNHAAIQTSLHFNNAVEKKAESDREMTRLLSADLQMVRKENNTLAEALTSKDDSLKKLRREMNEMESKLWEEERKNNSLNREMESLKVQFAKTEADKIPSTPKTEKTDNGDSESLATKLHESLEMQNELAMNVTYYKQKCDGLLAVVDTLKMDKSKLVQKLHEADKALVGLSDRVTPRNSVASSRVLSEASSSVSIDQINISLDEIKSFLNIFPQKYEASQQVVELRHAQAELQQANLQLVEEKAKVLQLKRDLSELESVAADDNSIHTEYDAKRKELQQLRSKHKQCVRIEKFRKRLLRDKKLLQRKCSSLHQQLQVVNALYQSLQTDIAYKEQIIDELTIEKKQATKEAICLRDNLESTKKMAADNCVLLEKYKRESSYLLEKLNTATEEREDMKKRSETLEARLHELASFSDVKETLTFIQENVMELKSTANASNLSEDANSSSIMETLTKKNIDLADKILSLQHKLSNDQQEFENLRKEIKKKDRKISNCKQEIERLENQIATENSEVRLHKTMQDSEYERRIENLTLEKEILTSRVLILEGIREEMDLLREEKDVLKVENEKLRNLANQRGTPVASLNKLIDNNSNLVLVNNPEVLDALSNDQFEENIKKLEELDENTKSRLREMLSTPAFESFLSREEVCIDLKNESDHFDNFHSKASLNSLSVDSFEDEHVINDMFQAESDPLLCESASYENVIQVYTPSDNFATEKEENTIDYVQEPKISQEATDTITTPPANNEVAQQKSPSQSSTHKSLDKLISESQSISKSIAAKKKPSGEVDYKKVLNEFQKVIVEMSRDNSSQTSLDDRKHSSFNPVKKVTFSDHVVNFYNEMKESGECSPSSSIPSVQTSDSNFYRSFFQDALKKTYPVLGEYEDEDIVNEIKEDESEYSSTNNFSYNNNNNNNNNNLQQHTNTVTNQFGSLRDGTGTIPKRQYDDAMTTNSDFSFGGEEVKEEVEPTFDQILDMVSKTSSSSDTQVRQSIYDTVFKLPQQASSSMTSRDKMKLAPSLPTLQEEVEVSVFGAHGDSTLTSTLTEHPYSSKALNVLKSFDAQDLQRGDNLDNIASTSSSKESSNNRRSVEFVIPTTATNFVNRPLYINSSSSSSSQNYGNAAYCMGKAFGEDSNPSDSRGSSEFTLGSMLRDEMSFDDFGGSLLANDVLQTVNANRLQVLGANRMASTPNIPSNMHKPFSIDFSDASFGDVNLFSNMKD